MIIWRSTIVAQMWRMPAVTSTNQWTSSRTGLVSSTLHEEQADGGDDEGGGVDDGDYAPAGEGEEAGARQGAEQA